MGKQSRKKQETREARARGEEPTAGGRNVPKSAMPSATRDLPVFWIVVGLIILAAFIALVTLGGGAEKVSASEFRSFSKEIQVDGEDLPDFPNSATASADDPAKGKPVPTITGQSLKKGGDSITISTETAKGKPFVVMFLAHWCPHCNAEVPKLVDEFKTNGKPKDIALFGIATDNDENRPNFPAGQWLAEENWNVPTMLDDENLLATDVYGIQGYPFFVFVNADGTVNYRVSGEIGINAFNKQLDALRANVKKDAKKSEK